MQVMETLVSHCPRNHEVIRSNSKVSLTIGVVADFMQPRKLGDLMSMAVQQQLQGLCTECAVASEIASLVFTGMDTTFLGPRVRGLVGRRFDTTTYIQDVAELSQGKLDLWADAIVSRLG